MPAGTASEDSEDPVSILRPVIAVITTVGTPLTMITALLLYFGWARSDAQSQWMGIEVSLFRFSTQDYVLRSISTLYLPILATAVIGIAWLAAHRAVTEKIERDGTTDTIRVICRVTMLGGLAVAILGVVMPALTRHWEPGSVVWPLMIAIGTALAVYGRHVSRQGRERARPRNAIARPHDVLEAVLVGIVIAAALFWAVQGYADIVGRGYAQRYEDSVSSLPRATAVSESPLGIDSPVVRTEQIAAGPKTLYRTTGLRLLAESGGRLFLMTEGWTIRDGSIIVLDESDSVHWQFSH
ncbi:Uncharacterised protein [Mycobacteroides abscessus subsp. abscessus]|uniref:hypothetical protein n=1 Tax=Mycobacteroides abscessus TaxID=36809 RepID=UPI00092A7697|nr:hypothetical protein [Mycobacteroides abscessus]SHR09499.1 Uncharacterised protein [Mycobacteroides abscessus subsp. abscessus]